MSNYAKTVNFAAKDALPSGDPGKIIKGTEIDTEFNNIAIASASKLDSTTLTSNTLPAGTKMAFFQAAAPTGWTQDTTVNDQVLRVVSSSGGGTGGNWTLSGMSVDSHTLTAAEIPAHYHTGTTSSDGAHTHSVSNLDPSAFHQTSTSSDAVVPVTGTNTTGSAGAHTHTFTTSTAFSGPAGHSHGLTNTSWRPAYIDVIICSKDAY